MKSRLTRSMLMAAASAATLASAASIAPASAQEGRSVEVITVTAQQREQSLQDVPLSVGAYGLEELANAGVRDIKDLISIAPGLMVTSTQAETITTARIRGIGTVGDNFGLESSVGVYIDGVFRARNGVGFGDIGELERIEVLRGPQGTLFGKNTSAGVLNIVTAGPEHEFGGHVEATVGDYGYSRLSGHVTGSIVEDELAFRLFAVNGERDGFTDLVVGKGANAELQDSDTQDYYSFRGQLLWTPSSNVEGRFIADYSERDEFCCSAPQWDFTAGAAALVGAVGGQVAFPADPSERVAFANRNYLQEVEDWGMSAEFDVDTGMGQLTSVTAYREWNNRRSQDIDYSSADLAYRDADNNFTDLSRFSQELRLQGVNGGLDWLVGAFYSKEELELGDAIRVGDDWETFLGLAASGGTNPTFISDTLNAVAMAPLFAPGTALPGGSGVGQDIYNQEAESWAIFTHNTLQLTDSFSITAGLRYTNEEKELQASFQTNQAPGCGFFEGIFGPDPLAGSAMTPLAGLVPLVCLPYQRSGLDANGYDQSREDEEFSGTLRATYRFNDDFMAYAGYSRGFKAGGFNLDREFNGPIGPSGYTDSNTAFAPEFIDAYEIGFKSTLGNGALQLNGNLFYQDIEDFQLNTFNGIAFVVNSIPTVESQGLELDFAYATPIEGLDIRGGYAWVDAQYGDDIPFPGLAGKNISLSPQNFLTTQITYERPVFNNLNGLVSIDARHVTDYNTGSDLDPEKEQDGFTLLNARVGLGREDGRWSVELWGRNLLDETYAQVAFDAFAQGSRAGAGTSSDPRGTASYDAFLGAPRTWGVTLRTEW
ncbi:TonB-dependent receptor [Marinicauda salina]|uniref:TonB-dependent receptor n=1 Tax=Marinicauda salina TaxID=2135793 RepID=A0A2U2BTX2_9PROT|nr:TonB-dependent receptor [Marinicauda salina]PWE17442.1 TonB-dependent receptor [Marinicauda salina]